MENIQERSVAGSDEVFTEETAVDNVAMDCLAVPATNCNTRQLRRMSPRQNSLPSRTFQRMSETQHGNTQTSSLTDSSLQRGSTRRCSKQELYQFLDVAIAQ